MDSFNRLYDEVTLGGVTPRAALMYDISGRGYSHSQTKHPMTIQLFVTQLEELLEALNIPPSTKLQIVAWSMGTIVGTKYAYDHPGTLTSVGDVQSCCCCCCLRMYALPHLLTD